MIEIHNLTKQFEDIRAVDEVSVEIKEKTVFGLIGTNGAGKSTVLRMIAGVIKPDEGTVAVDNMPVYDNVEAKKRLFFIADEPYFFVNSNARAMEKYYSGIYEAFDREEFYRYLEKFNLDKNRKISTFSKGMKKQLALLLGICAHTKYILCDETFDGLDPVMRTEILKLLQEYVMDGERSVIFSTHILSDLENIADYIYFIHGGRTVLYDAKDELIESFLLVKGESAKIPPALKKELIGLEEKTYGFEAILPSDKAELLGNAFLFEKPTIDQIVIHYIKSREEQ